MIDISHSGIGGGVLAALALYAAGSLVAGQVVSTRMIERSGWSATCPMALDHAARPAPQPRVRVPKRRCSDMVGFLGREAQAFCGALGDPDFNAEARRLEREAQRQMERLVERRRAEVAATAKDRCTCAAQLTKSDNVIPWAIYAGSARQISLPPVDGMEHALKQALASAQCKALGATP